MIRSLLTAALIAAAPLAAFAQSAGVPALRADVTVTADIVRIGDMIDNAGAAAAIAIYRAPDPGTTGKLPAAQVLATLRAHQVIGIDARNLREVAVTRLARTIDVKEIEQGVARALEHRNGLGAAGDIELSFDRGIEPLRLDVANTGALHPVAVRFDSRNGRFDTVFEIANTGGAAPARLRFTGTAVDTVEAVVLTRALDRNEIVKASDVAIERRPRAEVGRDVAVSAQVVGMQARRQLRQGQALRSSDLAKPDLVQRDQAVTIVYKTAGITLTIRGKALENGAEGDAVSVMNLQSKRTFSGTVVGRNQVVVTPQPVAATEASLAAPVAVAANTASSDPRTAESR
ncbi:MAG: flagellar basal body P-ring formation protein FlgA [Xanthobacteraceae bacterium]|nr:flagellar basal body P-ring formation protein FlgA [Xanthobacteraceae bacterium]